LGFRGFWHKDYKSFDSGSRLQIPNSGDMQVELVNDGPVTIIIDSKNKE
jgi:hypothetical protein